MCFDKNSFTCRCQNKKAKRLKGLRFFYYGSFSNDIMAVKGLIIIISRLQLPPFFWGGEVGGGGVVGGGLGCTPASGTLVSTGLPHVPKKQV